MTRSRIINLILEGLENRKLRNLMTYIDLPKMLANCQGMRWAMYGDVMITMIACLCVCAHVAILCSCSSLENTQVWAVDAEFHLMHQALRNNKVVTRDVGRGITAEHVSSKTSSYISIHQPKPCPTDHEQKNPVFEASTDCFTRCNCFETGRS